METQPSGSRWHAFWLPALAGVATGVIVIASWWLLYSLDLLTFPPYDLADLLIRQSPGSFATWTIETLGKRAQPVAQAGSVFVAIVAWGVIGVLVARMRDARWARLVPLVLSPLVFWLGWWSEGGLSAGRMIWLTILFCGTLLTGGMLLLHWITRLREAQQEAESSADDWLAHPGDYQRRALFRQILLATVAVGAGGTLIGRLIRSSGSIGPETAQGQPLATAQTSTDGEDAFPTAQPAPALPDTFVAPVDVRSRVTDNDEFYVVDISTRDPNLPEQSWALRVHGLVDCELVIGWRDLLAMPAVELDGTLMCISYEHDNGLISTTRWTGVPLRDLLNRAGVQSTAIDVICRGANDYSDSIPLAKALEPTTLLAYAMNGETLSREHGFPCRLYVPGLYGEKNVKWLEELELVDYDYRGYWQERGWSETAVTNTVAIIDTPRRTAVREGDVVPIGGIAFAGDRGISAVEVRIDDGEWQSALLEENDPPLIWQRWRFDWRPDLGEHRITARAVDGNGESQIEEERPPHPDGMTGLHTVTVDVV